MDVGAVGLADLARHDRYIERQLRRWHGQFRQSQQQARETGVYRPVPLVDDRYAPAALMTAVQAAADFTCQAR